MSEALALLCYPMHDATLVLRDSKREVLVSLRDSARDVAQKLCDDMREAQPFQHYIRRESPFRLCYASRDAARGLNSKQQANPTSTRKRSFKFQIKSAKEQGKHKFTTINTLLFSWRSGKTSGQDVTTVSTGILMKSE
ncbi:hypothetical protein HAX54_044666 [Datura stramonium]|uniref:Uncharacterized protein n=1 Tax=Datura stramonium TaxID=4076 RepID=A0ABS8WHA4_DATST|nr:hypothetical protein [Datura stramonium]